MSPSTGSPVTPPRSHAAPSGSHPAASSNSPQAPSPVPGSAAPQAPAVSTVPDQPAGDPGSLLSRLASVLRKRGIPFTAETDAMPPGLFRCRLTAGEGGIFAVTASGLTPGQSGERAAAEAAKALLLETFFTPFCTRPLPPRKDTVLIPPGEEGRLFSPDLRDRYDLDSYDPAAFQDPSGETEGITALPFTSPSPAAPGSTSASTSTSPSAEETILLPQIWLGLVFGSAAASAAAAPQEAELRSLRQVCCQHAASQLLTAPRPLGPLESLPDLPWLEQVSAWAREQGCRIRLYDATLEGRLPVLCAALFRQADQGVGLAFGSGATVSDAAEEAVLRLLPGDGIPAAPHRICAEYSRIMTAANLEGFLRGEPSLLPWDLFTSAPKADPRIFPAVTDPQKLLERLQECAEAGTGTVPLIRHVSLEGIELHQCILPGLSETGDPFAFDTSPTSAGNMYRHFIFSLEQDQEDAGELFASLEENGFGDSTLLAPMLGIMPDPGSWWASFTVAELKALTALARNEKEAALSWVERFLAPEDQPRILPEEDKVSFFRCCRELLRTVLDGEDPRDCRQLLEDLHGPAILKGAREAVEGKRPFWPYCLDGDPLRALDTHRRLADLLLALREG